MLNRGMGNSENKAQEEQCEVETFIITSM